MPENGIEPSGVPELIGLLRDYAVDPEVSAGGDDNPLRQVILNSHSRDVVGSLPAGEVLFVENVHGPQGRSAQIRSVDYADVWRPDPPRVSSDYFKQWIGELPRGQMTFGG